MEENNFELTLFRVHAPAIIFDLAVNNSVVGASPH